MDRAKYDFERPLGMRDMLPDYMVKSRYVEEQVRRVFESYGFQEIRTPIVEKFDLFALRSGDEIRSRMFVIDTPEGEMVLRPELTAPVCRVLSSGQADPSMLPHRFYYVGQCFRWERPQKGRYREFWQAGIELVGASSPAADAEIISLAVDVMEALGITSYVVNVGNIEILRGFMEDNRISPEVQNRVIGALDAVNGTISKFRLYRQRLREKGTLDKNTLNSILGKVEEMEQFKEEERGKTSPDLPAEVLDNLTLDSERKRHLLQLARSGATPKDRDFLDQLLADKEKELQQVQTLRWCYLGVEVELGEPPVRLPQEVATTLLSTVDLVGDRREVVPRAREVFSSSPKALQAIDQLEEILDLLERFGVTRVVTDISVARGLEFYTGMVFEINVPLLGAEKQVCGGGRYDRLVEEFGGPPTPATGFAFGLDRLILSMEACGVSFPVRPRAQILVIPTGKEVLPYAIEVAQRLRRAGIPTELEIMGWTLKKAISKASKMGTPHVAIVGPREMAEKTVTLRDMNSKTQTTTTIDQAIQIVQPGHPTSSRDDRNSDGTA